MPINKVMKMSIFCKHDYELISETTTESRIEHTLRVANENKLNCNSIKGAGAGANRKFIQVFTCKNCGDLKRFVEDI